jgi:hypothetical protein
MSASYPASSDFTDVSQIVVLLFDVEPVCQPPFEIVFMGTQKMTTLAGLSTDEQRALPHPTSGGSVANHL